MLRASTARSGCAASTSRAYAASWRRSAGVILFCPCRPWEVTAGAEARVGNGGIVEEREPVVEGGVRAVDDGREVVAQRGRHRARLPGADRASVHLANRRELRGGAGEERFVGGIELVAREEAFFDVESPPPPPSEGRWGPRVMPPSTVGSGVVIRRPSRTMKMLLSRALGDVPMTVEEDGLVIPLLERFVLREDGVDVSPRHLCLGRPGADRAPCK